MSEIIRTEAIVLNKINFSESSLVVYLFTKHYGLVSVLIKGGRRAKSKFASIVDLLNHIQVIFYKKETRDIQILSSADLISHFPNIKSDLRLLKYGYAICELIKNNLIENEINDILFRGLVKILNLLENESEQPAVLFSRFLLFFIKEIGYDLNLESCYKCSKKFGQNEKPLPFFHDGFLCESCSLERGIKNNSELFNFLFCLKKRKNITLTDDKISEDGINFLINYLKNHLENFRGINSLNLF
jgi:DNA repair protein RecO (recombination protein O)